MEKFSKILLWIIAIAVIGLGFYLFSLPRAADTSDWETYTNEEYGFSIKHPSDWQVFEDLDDPIAVKFNIYKDIAGGPQPPFTHHSSGATHVSIFPQGIPTEGVSGEQVPTEVNFAVPIQRASDYALSDGTRFATYANTVSPLGKWNDSGFIFSNVYINDFQVECMRNAEPIPENQCDVLTGDILVRHGMINEVHRLTQVAIMESFRFVEESNDGGVVEHKDLIRVFSPTRNSAVSSPLTITGEARGNWYFEATFPVSIEDANGNVLAQHYATAKGEWMTADFVRFEAELSFVAPQAQTGVLILSKDNPSGLPENDDELRIPIQFTSGGPQRSVQLYYYNPDRDKDVSGNIMCSERGLIAVERVIPITQTPIQDTVRLLLRGEITQAEAAQGITTEYPLPGFDLQTASLTNGTLTLRFTDPNSSTSGGSCRTNILWQQIKKTAEQFDEVTQARFEPEELFQP
ncbi:MAG: Gmad2 immunoglobulin-like domain-containing protein [Candidatus Colwellbacteria bacterium]